MKAAIYARVSTEEQTLDQQILPLIEYCKREKWEYDIYKEKASGANTSRTELDRLMYGVRSRQYKAVVVAKLDRLGRSLKHLIQLVEEFNNKDVQFVCLNPSVDTKTASGRFFIQIMGAVAELEREFIRERTKEKLEHLKKEGRQLGRPRGSKDKKPRRKSGYHIRWGKKNTPPKSGEFVYKENG